MRNYLGIGLIICLLTGGLKAQSVEKKAGASNGTGRIAKAAAADELIGLLPDSDLVAVIDSGRAINDLMPRLADIAGGAKWLKELQEFTAKTGIDLSKAQNAVVSLRFPSTQVYGALILQGLDLDDKKLETAMKAYNTEYTPAEYKGKKIFNLPRKGNAPSAGPLSLKTDELAITALGSQKLLFGDISQIRSIIDIQSGSTKGGVSKEMSGALHETRNSALARFAFNLPEHLRQEALEQGDIFASVAAIKIILGTLDVGNDLSLLLDMTMRTPTQKEASELEMGLKGLIGLARGFLSGGEMELYGQLLDQVKIGSKINDVTLSLTMPRSMVDQLGKKPNGEKK
jgi:hypothetical protein